MNNVRTFKLNEQGVFVEATPAPDANFWYQQIASLNPETAHRIDAVHACQSRIAETIASLSCKVYRRVGGGKVEAPEHAVYKIVHNSANEELTSFEFFETTVLHLLGWGNSYARIVTDTRKDVIELQVLLPWQMEVLRSPEGVRYYVYTHKDGHKETLRDDGYLLHIPGMGFDGLMGYSPIEMHQRTFGAAIHAEEMTAKFLQNGGIPPAYISRATKVTPAVLANLTIWLRSLFNRKNAGTLGVLDEGMEIKTVNINHRDLQYLETRKFQVEQICRIYNVPPPLVQDLSRATFSNIEHQDIHFTKHTIRPWVKRIESRLNKVLFGEREGNRYFCEFNLDAMMRGDAASRVAYYTALRNSGVITANEIRALENMNPIEGGDLLLIQGAMIPVEDAGKQIEAPKPAPEPETEEETEDEEEAA